MADPQEIEGWRQAHKEFSRAQLLQVLHEKQPYSAEHIAAKQALDSMDQLSQQSIYAVSRRTLSWTVVAAIAAIIAALAAIWSLVSAYRTEPPRTTTSPTPNVAAP